MKEILKKILDLIFPEPPPAPVPIPTDDPPSFRNRRRAGQT
jgi:hypothetical protein